MLWGWKTHHLISTDSDGLLSPFDASVLRILVSFLRHVSFHPYRVSLSWPLLSILSGFFIRKSFSSLAFVFSPIYLFLLYSLPWQIPDRSHPGRKACFGSQVQRTVRHCEEGTVTGVGGLWPHHIHCQEAEW